MLAYQPAFASLCSALAWFAQPHHPFLFSFRTVCTATPSHLAQSRRRPRTGHILPSGTPAWNSLLRPPKFCCGGLKCPIRAATITRSTHKVHKQVLLLKRNVWVASIRDPAVSLWTHKEFTHSVRIPSLESLASEILKRRRLEKGAAAPTGIIKTGGLHWF